MAASTPSPAAAPDRHDDTAVVIAGVNKHFGQTKALRGLDARIGYGRLTGLVGPDGAGKTTLMRIMTGLLAPNAGHVTVAAFDVVAANDAIHAHTGHTPQSIRQFQALSVKAHHAQPAPLPQ